MSNGPRRAAAVDRYRHVIALRPSDFTDTGHIGNVRFPEFAEKARLAWFRDGPWNPGSRIPHALIRVMKVDFLGTVRGESSEVYVDVEVLRIGRTSFTLLFTIGVPGDDVPRATVETVHVVTEADEATVVGIEGEERAMLQRHLTQEVTA